MNKKFRINEVRFKRISEVPPGYRTLPYSHLVTLFNSGKHVYMDINEPHWYEPWEQPLLFLPYNEYCGRGKSLYGIHFQHLGHVLGTNGGNAQMKVSCGWTTWELILIPCVLYTILQSAEKQIVFASHFKTVLPRTLLSHG